jgi:hypothetical protein
MAMAMKQAQKRRKMTAIHFWRIMGHRLPGIRELGVHWPETSVWRTRDLFTANELAVVHGS